MRPLRNASDSAQSEGSVGRLVIGAAILVGLLALPATAEYYRYTDANGQVHFVDDPGQIPDSQLDTLQVYEETPERSSPDPAPPPADGTNAVAPSSPDALESPVIVRGNQVLVPVVIGYRGREVEALLLLDTGASFTIVHENVARRVMLTGTENREAIVVGGSRIPIRMAQVDYIQVGPYRVSGAQVAIIRHKGPQLARQGLLGMDILQALDYRIDMNRRVIVWNR
ncbi:MAG: aspartyl protease family protein [Desulfobacterales bacterium]|jgi:predicted aspartyl protease